MITTTQTVALADAIEPRDSGVTVSGVHDLTVHVDIYLFSDILVLSHDAFDIDVVFALHKVTISCQSDSLARVIIDRDLNRLVTCGANDYVSLSEVLLLFLDCVSSY